MTLNKDLTEIDNYLSNHGIEALRDASGLRFTIDSLAIGHTPKITSTITFDYKGTLLETGAVFETSTLKNAAIDKLITGMQIGLQLIPNGSKGTLYIPSVYAYGSQSTGKIPANSILIFEIKLKSIVVSTTEKNQLTSDTVKIDSYLLAQNITATRDTSGLRYETTQIGTGATPGLYNKVKISYTGYLIDGTVKGLKFFTGTAEPTSTTDSRVANYIRGFQVGLQKMKSGGKAVFYIPSGLAFGSQELTINLLKIPANSNVIYEVELTEVLDP